MFTDCSSYYNALAKQSTFNENVFQSEIKLDLPKREISYHDYCAEYQPKKVAFRKIIAIPMAFFAGLIKTIYHLACAILLGIRDAIKRKGNGFRANIYKISCDFKEAAGYVVTLFNDRRGSYIIQKSTFNKICSDAFQATSIAEQKLIRAISEQATMSRPLVVPTHKPRPPTPPIRVEVLPHPIPPEVALKFAPIADATIEQPAQPIVDAVAPIVPIITEEAEESTAVTTEQPAQPTADPKPQVKSEKSIFEGLSQADLQALTIAHVEGITPEEVQQFKDRIVVPQRNIDKEQFKSEEDILSFPLCQLGHLTTDELIKASNLIPKSLHLLFDPVQVSGFKAEAKRIELMELRDETEEQESYIRCFRLQPILDRIGGIDRLREWLNETPNNILSGLSLLDLMEDEFYNSRLSVELLSVQSLLSLTIEEFMGFPETIERRIIDRIHAELNTLEVPTMMIPQAPELADVLNLSLQQLCFLPSKQIHKCIKWMDPKACALFTDLQIKNLDITLATPEQLSIIFFSNEDNENKRKIVFLSDSQLNEFEDKLLPQDKELFLKYKKSLQPQNSSTQVKVRKKPLKTIPTSLEAVQENSE